MELKFRHFDLYSKRMMYSDKDFFSLEDYFSGQAYQESDDMQFTGLKDKNGAEIYAGDICKCNYFNGSKSKCHFEVVEFNNGKFDLTWTINKLFKSFRSRSCFNGHSDAFEVIGNIYENPELLEQSK